MKGRQIAGMTEPGAGGAQPPDFGSAGNIIQGQPPVAVLALSQPGRGRLCLPITTRPPPQIFRPSAILE